MWCAHVDVKDIAMSIALIELSLSPCVYQLAHSFKSPYLIGLVNLQPWSSGNTPSLAGLFFITVNPSCVVERSIAFCICFDSPVIIMSIAQTFYLWV